MSAKKQATKARTWTRWALVSDGDVWGTFDTKSEAVARSIINFDEIIRVTITEVTPTPRAARKRAKAV